ncbi:hypothetical protein [Paenibacillus polymyxa]|uniref:hypothetical protein n=1 Tax=Paenibacillus polymyxa TaxID=1406 RepID=UPI0012686E52|nr:hypothetical protein [Paenibacillus polymyxa]
MLFENNIISIGILVISIYFFYKTQKRERVGIFFSVLMFSFFSVFLPLFISVQSFNIINLIKPSLFYEYASKGQFKKEIIITKENLDKNDLDKIIMNIQKKLETVKLFLIEGMFIHF